MTSRTPQFYRFMCSNLCLILLWTSTVHPTSSFFASAYRVGDVVDAVVSTKSSNNIELLMAARPLFGVSRTIQLARLPERFSLSFEEGLHSLPYVDGQALDVLRVIFVYSKSGEGRIHRVSSKAIWSDNKRSRLDKNVPIDVSFEWVEEEAVDLQAGSSVMFLTVLVVSILFLLQLCGVDDDVVGVGNEGKNNKYRNGQPDRYESYGGYASDTRYNHRE